MPKITSILLPWFIAGSIITPVLILVPETWRSSLGYSLIFAEAVLAGMLAACFGEPNPLRNAFIAGIVFFAWVLFTLSGNKIIDEQVVLLFAPLIAAGLLGGFIHWLFTWLSNRPAGHEYWEYAMGSDQKVTVSGPTQMRVYRFVWLTLVILFFAAFVYFTALNVVQFLIFAGIAGVCLFIASCSKGRNAFRFTTFAVLLVTPLFLNGELILAYLCYAAARRCYSQSARQALAKDQRQPIVFLRSFADEGAKEPFNLWASLLRPLQALLENTLEQRLVAKYQHLGPVIAIGKPGEVLTTVGACRLYVSHEHWKEVVQDMVKRSQLVIFQAGSTPGLQHELTMVQSTLQPEQLLIFLPYYGTRKQRQNQYDAFRKWAEPIFPLGLPWGIDAIAWFLAFRSDPAWEAKFLYQPLGAKLPVPEWLERRLNR